MLSAALLGLAAGSSGVLVVGGVGVATVSEGKWTSLSVGESESPKPTQSVLNGLTGGKAWSVSMNGASKASSNKLAWMDHSPMGMGWGVDGGEGVSWFGTQPKAVKVNSMAVSNPTYVKAVADFLKTKGYKAAKPVIQSITQVDLDGNGSLEVVVAFTSKKADAMANVLNPFPGNKFPNDYAGLLVRTVKGSSVQTIVAAYSDGKKSGVANWQKVLAVADFDGLPGAELIVESTGWEDTAWSVHNLKGGKLITLAEAGVGV